MSDTTIDTILEDFFHPPQPPSDTVKIVYKPIDPKYYKELKSALYDLILKEVVDTKKDYVYVEGKTIIETASNIAEVDKICDIREELRAEQRNKLKQLFERSDNE